MWQDVEPQSPQSLAPKTSFSQHCSYNSELFALVVCLLLLFHATTTVSCCCCCCCRYCCRRCCCYCCLLFAFILLLLLLFNVRVAIKNNFVSTSNYSLTGSSYRIDNQHTQTTNIAKVQTTTYNYKRQTINNNKR